MKDLKVDFFVVGAARCGTTSLYNYLNQHPDIFLPNIKELNYFSRVESKDSSDYKEPKKDQQYHTKIIKSEHTYNSLFNNSKENQINGDISPSYLWDTETANRIYKHNPKAKIIISLRNPIHRAFSHYVMNYSIGQEKHDNFRDALNAKTEMIWGGGNLYEELSYYYKTVLPYYQIFGKENIHTLIFEEWTSNKDTALEEIFNFLGVDRNFIINHSIVHNEKVAYKNIKTLNFLRSRFIKSFLDFFLFTKTKNRLKDKFFKKEDFTKNIDPEIQNELKNNFRKDVEQLEILLKVSLIKKWNLE